MASLLLISIIVLNFGMPLCNVRQLQFSNRMTTFISILGVCGSIFLISFCDAFWQYFLIYGIVFGMFIGFGYLAPIKNCYQHIPQLKGTNLMYFRYRYGNEGLCSGVCILGYGISSLLFNFILLALINPNNESSKALEDGRKIYSREVADNVPFALRIMSAIYLGIGLVGIALMNPPKDVQPPTKTAKDQEDGESVISSSEGTQPLLETKRQMTLRELAEFVVESTCWLI